MPTWLTVLGWALAGLFALCWCLSERKHDATLRSLVAAKRDLRALRRLRAVVYEAERIAREAWSR